MSERDESKLPKWAQEKLASQRSDMEDMGRRFDRLQQAHFLLMGRQWFTVPGPPDNAITDNRYNLWFLSNSGAHAACSLGKGDVLLVGRKQESEADA